MGSQRVGHNLASEQMKTKKKCLLAFSRFQTETSFMIRKSFYMLSQHGIRAEQTGVGGSLNPGPRDFKRIFPVF